MKQNIRTEIKTTLRPICENDLPFLATLYATTRQDEMALLNEWNEQQKRAFLQSQFDAQHKFYTQQFSSAQFDIIQLQNKAIGRLYVDRRKDEIRIIDIALLPQYRQQGIGSRYMKMLINEAHAQNQPVRIHVEQFNPARTLYTKLGFQKIQQDGIYILMECAPV